MYRIAVVVTAAVIVAQLAVSVACGQEQTEDTRRNSLEAGAWAIQFQITEEIGLKPFNGMMISLKRHLSEGSAVRLGVNLNLNYDDTEWTDENTPADTLRYVSRSTQKQNGQSVELDLMYMGYPNVRAPVNFFWGTGPLIEYSRGHRESERVATALTETFTQTDESSSHSWEAGVLGAAGIEWFATKAISFHAEYRARASYRTSEVEQSSMYDSESHVSTTADRTSWQFSAVNVILGLSVYF